VGITAYQTPGSIERSGGLEKRFYRGHGVGFYASPHDGKMTEKRGFTIIRSKNPALARPGIRPGKTAGSALTSR
jgi:hypothetical protein